VYRARDERLGRTVALKFLREGRRDEEMVERLRREARVLANLSHPAIMAIYALEEAAGHVFLAVEHVDGRDLEDELGTRRALPAREAVEVAERVAEALAYALELGVIHRDVKLENVMRTSRGGIKLTDFGLAKALSGEEGVTQSGVYGTPGYMAPELLRGEPATFRTDMYALGVVLERLVRGAAPPTLPLRPDAPDSHRPSAVAVPGPLVPILARLTDAEPERRYGSYRELLAELAGARAQL